VQLLWTAPDGLSLQAVGSRVVGATAKEVKHELAKLVRSVQVIEVCTPYEVVYCSAQAAQQMTDLLDVAGQEAMICHLQQQIAFLKKCGKSQLGATIPRPHVRLTAAAKNADNTCSAVQWESLDVLAQIESAIAEHRGPVRIPDLMPQLGVSVAAAHAALLSGARAGRFDLQPESGMARLSPEEAKWCPPGPGQTTLAWLMLRAPR
jgi:hypothetical protein